MIYLNLNANILLNTSIVLIIGDIFFYIRFTLRFVHQRFELRLKAIQRTGSSAQMPLPFSLARTLPRSPLRSDNGHRNRDGSLCSPIPSSLRSSLRLPPH